MHGIVREVGCSEKLENMASVKQDESQAGRGALCWDQQEAREGLSMRDVHGQGCALWSLGLCFVELIPRRHEGSS